MCWGEAQDGVPSTSASTTSASSTSGRMALLADAWTLGKDGGDRRTTRPAFAAKRPPYRRRRGGCASRGQLATPPPGCLWRHLSRRRPGGRPSRRLVGASRATLALGAAPSWPRPTASSSASRTWCCVTTQFGARWSTTCTCGTTRSGGVSAGASLARWSRSWQGIALAPRLLPLGAQAEHGGPGLLCGLRWG